MNTEQLSNLIREKTLKREDTSLLKWVLGECQLYGKEPLKVMEKLYEDNMKSFNLSKKNSFLEENKQLELYLPKYLTTEEISYHVKNLGLDKSSKSLGVAIKHLKSLNLNFRTEDVKKIVL